MTKNEFKTLKNKLNKRMNVHEIEIKALQSAIDRSITSFKKVKETMNELKFAHH